jgi:hypothetical protein
MIMIMKKLFFLLVFFITILVGCCTKPHQQPIVDSINKEISSSPTAAGHSQGHSFYIDPINGNMDNSGSLNSPWLTLEEVIKNRLIESKNIDGVIKNPNAPVKPGDTIILMSGYHGDIKIKYAFNDKPVTIKADTNSTPIISSLTLNYGSNWVFDGITVDGSLSNTLLSPKSYMVSIGVSGKYGDSKNIKIQNFHIYSDQNTENWNIDDWNQYSYNGIITGSHLQDVLIKNNYIENVNLAINIASKGTVSLGNRISYFAKDAIRISNNNIAVMYNIITDNLNVNENHDDAIQGYAGVNGVHDVLISDNIIIENHDFLNQFTGPLQGIGFFDGPLSGIVLENNLIKISGYHAISLYDSERGKIANNIVTGIDKNKKSRIALGTKNKGGLNENIVLSNIAQVFLLELDKKVIANENKTIKLTDGDELYQAKLRILSEEINRLYGEEHVTSKKLRFSIN